MTDTIATERYIYSNFLRTYVAYRSAQIPRMLVDLDSKKLQLPNMSTLHTINHFLTQNNFTDLSPDTTNPLLEHESWSTYFKPVMDLPTPADSPLFPIREKFVYNPGPARAHMLSFFNDHKQFHRILSETAVGKMTNVLAWYDYTTFHRMHMTVSQNAEYRKFDVMLRVILNRIVQDPSKRFHFIQVPLSDQVYSRSQLLPMFSKIDRTTVRIKTDPSLFFEMHLLGAVFGRTGKLTVTPYDTDGQDDHGPLRSTSLFDRLPDDLLDRVHVILTHGGKAIIYNLGDLFQLAGNSGFFMQVLRHINTLKLVGLGHHEDTLHQLKDDAFEQHVDAVQNGTAPIVPVHLEDDTTHPSQPDQTVLKESGAILEPAPVPLAPEPIHDQLVPVKEAPSTPKAVLDHALQTLQTNTTAPLTAPQIGRTDTLYQKHMNTRLHGISIAEHLNGTHPSVAQGSLPFLKPLVTDPTILQSSVANLDADYMKFTHSQDLAKTLSSFIQHGMFVSDIKEYTVHDAFNHVHHYRVKFIDHQGRQHSVSFKLPHVDDNGRLKVNGVSSRMVKQQVNLPICKIDAGRVNLSSNYNKTLVERSETVVNNYANFIIKYLKKLLSMKLIQVSYKKTEIGTIKLPYDYQTIGLTFSAIKAKGYQFWFAYPERFHDLTTEQQVKASIHERTYGIFCGTYEHAWMFWDQNNAIHLVDPDGGPVVSWPSLMALFHHLFGDQCPTPQTLAEWTNLRILDKTFPMIMILGYRFGLSSVFQDIHLNYQFVEKGTKIPNRVDQIKVPFSDGTLIFSRYPLAKSLLAAGLLWGDTSRFAFKDMDNPDTYYSIFKAEGISIEYFKGISNFFDFFIDPITRDVLTEMGEPTTVKALLYRANAMLSTLEHYPSSSVKHHRMRGYERFSSVLYNRMSRDFATYQNNRSPSKVFSINPESVFQEIMQDPTVMNTETINPFHEIKNNSHVTFSGSGGRKSAQSFVVKDRQFPLDAVGAMSESTPDNGKVAMTVFSSVDPLIKNNRGMYDNSLGDQSPLQPGQMLSTAAMLIPGATQDDGKRVSYITGQMSHHVPCLNGGVNRMRTGFETTIAHRVSDVFASTAKEDGVVIQCDPKLGVLKIQYNDHPVTITGGSLTLPYTKEDLETSQRDHHPVSHVITPDQQDQYPLDRTFSLGNHLVAKVSKIQLVSNATDLTPEAAKHYATLVKLNQYPLYMIELTIVPDHVSGDVLGVFLGDRYTEVSGSHLKQSIIPNVKLGDHVKAGDVVAYNPGFFVPEPDSKQVSWKHGVEANVVLIETSSTLEDGCVITKSFGDKLAMRPAHVRPITIENHDALYNPVKIGDHVQTTDYLCEIQLGDLEALLLDETPESLSFLMDLGKKAPTAKYHGVIEDIVVYHACPFDELHPSIQKLAMQNIKQKTKLNNAFKNTTQHDQFVPSNQVSVGMRYKGLEFEANTVLIEFTISEEIGTGAGDKIVFGGSAKSVISEVVEKDPYTESGIAIDAIFSSTSILNRLIASPYLMGISGRVLEKLEQNIVKIWEA